MKIAHICPFYVPAICGVKQVVQELAERQAKKGHEVHVYTSDWDKNQRIKNKEEIINKVHVHRCYHIFKIANFATIWPSVFFRLLRKKFDIIHSHLFGHLHFILAAYAARLRNTPHIHTTHCPWTDSYRSYAGKKAVFFSYNFFSRWALKLTKKIIAITPWEINFIKKYNNEEKIEVLPNGMSSDFFVKIQSNDFRKKYNIQNKIILFFGRLNITKSPDKFVEIAKLILKERDDATFVICGPDEGMKQKVKELIGNESKILLLPETRDRKEVLKIYQSADIYVLPSYREGLPLTLFEAMASGLPVVATPVNGVSFEIQEGVNGFLVEHGDNEGFKKRIIELLDNLDLKKRISLNNVEKTKEYTWDNLCEKTMEIYKKAMR